MTFKTRPLFSYELETVVLRSFLSLMPLFILKNCRPPASEVSEGFMLHGQIGMAWRHVEGRGYRFTPLLEIERYEVSIINVWILLLTLRAYPGARVLVKSPDSVRVAKSPAREQHSIGDRDASARCGIGKGRFSFDPGGFAARSLARSLSSRLAHGSPYMESLLIG